MRRADRGLVELRDSLLEFEHVRAEVRPGVPDPDDIGDLADSGRLDDGVDLRRIADGADLDPAAVGLIDPEATEVLGIVGHQSIMELDRCLLPADPGPGLTDREAEVRGERGDGRVTRVCEISGRHAWIGCRCVGGRRGLGRGEHREGEGSRGDDNS
ncbi:hypothetical protein BKA15_006506 [Microlunatus parietis]|uniref:Uncharacterized protein n=1 Tax=Microlunatus parietis TaxID=682979 RepID=A0A7Y9IE27_9ACTN|nr:hypothetical protein [Microlunatus parietis]NYE75177.1 hypothetical protein [Microlunatus parietis]